MAGVNRWVALLAGCCTRAVATPQSSSSAFARSRRLGENGWGPFDELTLDILVDVLPGSPILTPTGAARLLGRSFRAANQAIAALTEAEILRQITVGRRNRAFEAIDVIDAFTDFERQLGSPEGDTLAGPPTRPVPDRPSRGEQ